VKGQGLERKACDFDLARADDLLDEGGREGHVWRKEDAGFGGLEGGAVDVWDDAAGMGVEAEVVGEGGVACDHFAFGFWFTQAGHGVGHAFYMVGEECFEVRAQGLRGALEGWGERCEVGFYIHRAPIVSYLSYSCR
jgi:hypothetical protein